MSEFDASISVSGWVFYEHFSVDFGIDGHVETTDSSGYPSGAQVAVQIKGGQTEFKETSDDGWWFRFKDSHYQYWTNYCLPVYVVLVDTATRTFFWQRVTALTAVSTGKNWKVKILRSNSIEAALETWAREAGGFLDEAQERAAFLKDFLPPSAIKALVPLQTGMPDVVAHLTSHLGGSAGSPALAVRSLLDAPPAWLQQAPGEAYSVIAGFASEHHLPDEAADAYLVGADALPERRTAHLTAAAANLIDQNHTRAHQIFASISEVPEASMLNHSIIGAMLAHPVDEATPIAEPHLLAHEPAAAARNVMAQAFLGGNASRRGDHTAAIDYLSAGLALEPQSSVLMLQLAEAYGRRSGSAAARSHDLSRALTLTDDAYRQRQQWRGPTADALALQLQVLLLRGEPHEVLRRGRAAPEGTASSADALIPDVLNMVVNAAGAVRDLPLARELAAQMPDSAQKALVELDLSPDAESEEALATVLDRALAEDNPTVAVHAVLRLSHLGIDRSSALQSYRDAGIVTQLHLDLPAAIARSRDDLNSALLQLRALANGNLIAAQVLVQALVEAGRYDEALAEVNKLSDSLRVHVHDLCVHVLLEAGRADEAEAAAADALTDPNLGAMARQDMFRLLASRAGQRDDPRSVVTWCQRALSAAPANAPDRTLLWWLISSHLDVGDVKRAWQAYLQYALDPAMPAQIRTWTNLHHLQGWDSNSSEQALALAQTWADDPVLSAGLLQALLLGSTQLSGDATSPDSDFDARVAAEITAHCDRFGDTSSLQRREFNPDNLTEMFRESLQPRAEAQQTVLRGVHLLRHPIGILAQASGRPYGLVVIQRGAGMFPACTPDLEEFEKELDAARALLAIGAGARAAVDATSLHLSVALGAADLFSPLQVRRVLPRASKHDIHITLLEARQLLRSPGTISWDVLEGRTVFHETSPEEQNEILRRAEVLDAASRHCEVAVEGPITLGGEKILDGCESWLAPVQVAVDQGIPLWSDDVVVRRIAREAGVAVFGTLSLIQALIDRDGDLPAEEFERLRAAALAEWVVDAPWTVDEIVEWADRPDQLLAPLLGVLARPWRYLDGDEGQAAVDAVLAAEQVSPDVHRQWFTAAALGRILIAQPPALGAMVFAGAVGLACSPQTERIAKYIVWTRELLVSHCLPGDPVEHLDMLASAVTVAGGDASALSTAVWAELARLEADQAEVAARDEASDKMADDASSDEKPVQAASADGYKQGTAQH